jgi:hypothetical protein
VTKQQGWIWLQQIVTIALALLIALFLGFFALHAWQILNYPYPLDYGEGPLLAQIEQLRTGTLLWQLYTDPSAPPFLVVNYPPGYHLVTLILAHGLTWFGGEAPSSTLLAGRIVSFMATIGCTGAIWVLTNHQPSYRWLRLVLVLAFLALGIVREWSVLMRVDLLGICLGLWAVVIVQRSVGTWRVLWAVPLLILSLFCKPSLIAAPAAIGCWLLFRDWQRALGLGSLTALVGGILYGALHFASNGWFTLHVLTANVNEWQQPLAEGFWRGQATILWPLVVAAGISGLWQMAKHGTRQRVTLPLYYTLFGTLGALGIGKVGAYLNYFLEAYVGLIWLVALITTIPPTTATNPQPQRLTRLAHNLLLLMLPLLCAAALMRYYPLWSLNHLKPYGLIEGVAPPRLALGRGGVWQDLRRERDVLNALARTNAALINELHAVDGPILTDIPGVAAQAARRTPLQAFEHRMLFDVGAWDQRHILADLANGRFRLIVLDYLGNWLTPEMITLIKQRYVQVGSRGTYDLYQPIALGTPTARNQALGAELMFSSVATTPPIGTQYEPGELLTIGLTISDLSGKSNVSELPTVLLQLRNATGNILVEQRTPLLYKVFDRSAFADGKSLQHLETIQLPPDLAPGNYELQVSLLVNSDPEQAIVTEQIAVGASSGQRWGRFGYFVPGALLTAVQGVSAERWRDNEPQMPAVHIAGAVLQCFSYDCFQVVNGKIERLPLGERLQLADSAARPTSNATISTAFQGFYTTQGGAALLGSALTSELQRGDWIAQYTRYTRLERLVGDGPTRFGALGAEYLRLPNGGPYRWPVPHQNGQ